MNAALPSPAPFLATHPADILYLTGLNLEGFWLLVSGDTRTVFAPELLAGQIRELLPAAAVVAGNDLVDSLVSHCRKRKIKTIQVDFSKLSHGAAARIEKYIIIENSNHFIAHRRIVKTSAELEAIAESCALASRIYTRVRALIKPGMTELQIAFKIEELFAKNSVRPSFTPIVAAGPNAANPHHISSHRAVGKNDIILIDMGCLYNGYASDLTRTFAIGKITYLYRTVYALVSRAHRKAIATVRPGVSAHEVDGVARGVITGGGYGKEFIHSTGHGVGIEVHEPPRLSARDSTVLKEGMVVTVEPGIYLPGQFGVRIEDTIEVTHSGRKVLTQ